MSATDPLTRTEARSAARKMVKAGYLFVTITEYFGTDQFSVEGSNRCSNRRQVETMSELANLLNFEGA